jgi:hypothetical protein
MKKIKYSPRYQCRTCPQVVEGKAFGPITKREAERYLNFSFALRVGSIDIPDKIPHYHSVGNYFGVADLIALVPVGKILLREMPEL